MELFENTKEPILIRKASVLFHYRWTEMRNFKNGGVAIHNRSLIAYRFLIGQSHIM